MNKKSIIFAAILLSLKMATPSQAQGLKGGGDDDTLLFGQFADCREFSSLVHSAFVKCNEELCLGSILCGTLGLEFSNKSN